MRAPCKQWTNLINQFRKCFSDNYFAERTVRLREACDPLKVTRLTLEGIHAQVPLTPKSAAPSHLIACLKREEGILEMPNHFEMSPEKNLKQCKPDAHCILMTLSESRKGHDKGNSGILQL